MKSCRECGIIKPLTDYYTHKEMADGHLNKCKSCVKMRVKRHRNENIDRIREYDRHRGLFEHRKYRVRANAYKYKESGTGWRKRNPERYTAHIIVGNALRSGKLINPCQCERCGTRGKVHAHHEDYTKPLDVIWLCRWCHGERHREINEERRQSVRQCEAA